MNTTPETNSSLKAVALAAALCFSSPGAGALAPEGAATGMPALGSSSEPRVTELLGAADRLGVDWASLFSLHGYDAPRRRPDFVDLHGGIEALVLEDNFSAGLAVDMSAYAGAAALAESVVYNGTVAPAHDLGNVYVYTNFDPLGDLVLYAAVERLYRSADSYLEIELNQDRVGVAGGVPWPIRGSRMDGDLLIRAEVSQGMVSAVEVLRWAGGGFEPLASYGGLVSASCNGEPGVALFCSSEPRFTVVRELWDGRGHRVEPVHSERLFEVGVNVGRLLGAFVEYSAIQVRSPEDIVLGAFRATGYWARRLTDE